MIFKETKLTPVTPGGIVTVKCFHIYKKHPRKGGFVGDFIKASIFKTLGDDAYQIRKKKLKTMIVRTKCGIRGADGSVMYFNQNTNFIEPHRNWKKRVGFLFSPILPTPLVSRSLTWYSYTLYFYSKI